MKGVGTPERHQALEKHILPVISRPIFPLRAKLHWCLDRTPSISTLAPCHGGHVVHGEPKGRAVHAVDAQPLRRATRRPRARPQRAPCRIRPAADSTVLSGERPHLGGILQDAIAI